MNGLLLFTALAVGAPAEEAKAHWAYQPPVKAKLPAEGNPVDAFLQAQRAKLGVVPNAEADRATLLRRVYVDLIGVPPTREELDEFLKESAAKPQIAYEAVVDKLLASPMYGERWGRHWMDVWRYSDPFGNGEEFRYSQRHIWRWGDWVIESLNADKAYDRMIVEMLAGDEIAPADRDVLRATGYLARNWYKFNRNVWIHDTVDYTAAGFLGVTLRCARCHDHKYDPIKQEEYYRFRAFFEPHDVRLDPVPGQPDVNKDGVARVFDKPGDAPTYVFARGDERMPDKSKPVTPGTPVALGPSPNVMAVKFTPKDFAAGLKTGAAEARAKAKADVDAAETGVKRAADSVASAKHRLQDIVAGVKPKEPALKPFLHDTFAKKDEALWKVVSGTWAWEKGKLVCKARSTFATVSAKVNHPSSLMGRIRYTTTGGGVGSVGFSYDVVGTSFQAVYINAGATSAVRPFHRINGQDSYPAEGVVPFPVKLNDEVSLDFAVRGDRLNVWVNGKLTSVYKLPVARKPGAFTLWTHDATAVFHEVKLIDLPDSVALAEKSGEAKPSPISGPVALTKEDAEKLVKQAEAGEALAKARLETARASVAAVEARFAADSAQFENGEPNRVKALAIVAGKAERKVTALRAAEAVLIADAAKLPAAKKALADAEAAAAKDEPKYTPLVKADPAGSTGRRLALAKWITNRKNPLTARVAVNHIWMRHFGTPLVATVANFGPNGKKPTHPELLDWLAVDFMDNGWSMKKLHRLIVTSKAYQLGSRNDSPAKAIDPENRSFWRANPRRLEAEAVRDSMLAIAGQLDRTMGGPPLDEKLGLTSRRRSVYFRFNSQYKMEFLDQFDAASPTECYERRESVIPQQALALHNSVLALNMTRELAKQLSAKATEPGAFVTAAFEHVLTRPPSEEERRRCEAFLREQAELYKQPAKLTPFPAGPGNVTPPAADPAQRAREDLVHTLFNHNDFVTVR